MGRQPCCDKIGLKRGPWTVEEDQKLINFILNNGIHCWRLVPKLSGLMRCGKSCRLRWINYLRPDLKRGALSETEETQIIQLHSLLGNRWSKIASYFPGRTDNEIKNHWNTRIKKRLNLLGFDPMTRKPIEEEVEICDSKGGDHAPQSSHSDEQEQITEIIASTNTLLEEFPTMEEKEDRIKLGLDGNGAILNGNGMWRGCSNKEEVQPAATDPSTSCSTSFSLDDTLYPSSVGGDSYIQGCNLYWADGIDSVPSWEGLHHIEDIFSFGSYP